MFRTVIGKTLFEKRWTILWWSLALLITNILVIQLFPAMRDAFATMTQNLPPELEVWFGAEGEIWTSLRGYVNLEIMSQMAIATIVFAIVFSLSIFASEENSGVMLTQLSRPVRRWSFLLQKFVAFIIATILVMVGFYLGTFLGSVILNDIIPLGDLFLPMVAVTLLTIVFGALTLAISAISGSKAVAGVVVGCYALAGYFITSLSGTADILVTLSKATPFHYYNTPSVMENGFELHNVIILLALIVVPILIALPIFSKRDLNTR